MEEQNIYLLQAVHVSICALILERDEGFLESKWTHLASTCLNVYSSITVFTSNVVVSIRAMVDSPVR